MLGGEEGVEVEEKLSDWGERKRRSRRRAKGRTPEKIVVLLDFVQMRGGRARPTFFGIFCQ